MREVEIKALGCLLNVIFIDNDRNIGAHAADIRKIKTV